jgi:hypothetical protein
MIYAIFAFIWGFLVCAALCWRRLYESRRAFNAAVEQNKALGEKVLTQANALAKIQDLLISAKREGVFDLGGSASLPTSAKRIGQHLAQDSLGNTTGSSR